MNKYEVCVVLSAKLEDDERAAAIEKVKGYITRFGGTVGENIQEWGKKRLAYEIQHMKEGYYYFIPFTGDSNTPNELESHIRIMEPVLRYLVVKPETDAVAVAKPVEDDKTAEAEKLEDTTAEVNTAE